MNWIPTLMKVASGDLENEQVVKIAHELWESEDEAGRYTVDSKQFSNLVAVAQYLHVGWEPLHEAVRLSSLRIQPDVILRLNGHVITYDTY